MAQAEKIIVDESESLTDKEIEDEENMDREEQAQKRTYEKLASRYKSLEDQKLALDQEALLAGMSHLQMKHDQQNSLFPETLKENITAASKGGGGSGSGGGSDGGSGQQNRDRRGGGGSYQRGNGRQQRGNGRQQRGPGGQQRSHGSGDNRGGHQTRGQSAGNRNYNYNGVAKYKQPLSDARLIRKLEHEIIGLKKKLLTGGRVFNINNNY